MARVIPNATPGEYPCEKCGSNRRKQTTYRTIFAHGVRQFDGAIWCDPCVFGRCPNSEHLHQRCRQCGFSWVEPCCGAELGEPVQEDRQPKFEIFTPQPKASWWSRVWLRLAGST